MYRMSFRVPMIASLPQIQHSSRYSQLGSKQRRSSDLETRQMTFTIYLSAKLPRRRRRRYKVRFSTESLARRALCGYKGDTYMNMAPPPPPTPFLFLVIVTILCVLNMRHILRNWQRARVRIQGVKRALCLCGQQQWSCSRCRRSRRRRRSCRRSRR